MPKLLLLLILSSSFVFALTLDEAIKRANHNNPLIKEQNYNYHASQANKQSVASSFLPSLDLAYSYDSYSIANFVGQSASSSASSTLSYNLFNGFKDSATLQSAKTKILSQEHQKKAALEDLKLRVTLSYINYIRSVKEIEIAQDSYKLLQIQYKDAKIFQQQGIFAKNEALQVHVELLLTKQLLLQAKQKVYIARVTLKREMGGLLDDDEVLEVLKPRFKNLNYNTLENKMYENRSELKVLDAQRLDLQYQREALIGGYLPAVDVKLKYQVAGNDIIPKGGESFLRNDEKSVGISMSWNLYEGGKSKEDRTKLFQQGLASEQKIENMKLQLNLQLLQTVESLKLSRSQIEVAGLSLEQARENFRIVNEQFKFNIASSFVLLEAQKLLTRAKVSYHNAYFLSYEFMAKLERIIEKKLF